MWIHTGLVLTVAFLAAPGITVIDVGQGAAMLAVGTEGDAILVDSGPSAGAEAIVHVLGSQGIEVLDLVVHTHFDADHIGGISRLAAGADGVPGTGDDIHVVRAWDRGDGDLPHTGAVASYIALLGDRRQDVHVGDRYVAPGLVAEVVHAAWPGDTDENQRGIALCLDVSGLRVFAPGDLPSEMLVAAAAACGPADVLWASHHDAESGTSRALLDALDPRAVVISAGMHNAYCHPAPETLARLRDHSVWIIGAAGVGGRVSVARHFPR